MFKPDTFSYSNFKQQMSNLFNFGAEKVNLATNHLAERVEHPHLKEIRQIILESAETLEVLANGCLFLAATAGISAFVLSMLSGGGLVSLLMTLGWVAAGAIGYVSYEARTVGKDCQSICQQPKKFLKLNAALFLNSEKTVMKAVDGLINEATKNTYIAGGLYRAILTQELGKHPIA